MSTKQQKQANTAPVLKIKKLREDAVVPEAKTDGAVGLDLTIIEDARIAPTTTTDIAYMLKTGLAMEIPQGYHGKIFLRSSTGAKRKLRLANGTGIIDADYRGEVCLLIENVGALSEYLYAGDRIAQIIIDKNTDFQIQLVEELSDTARGQGGFGSTNKEEK